jgi:predicted SnoaL-like aldol condensation-catalyzing enzyme
MDNKQTAVAFLTMCALQSPKEAFAKFVNVNFRHHNQYFPGDRDSLMNAMTEADKTHPNKTFTVKQVFEAADKVAVHSHVVKDSMEIAVVHMLRFESGKISEMWDVGQIMEKNSPNMNGMF